jgi:FMN phosphatase YigB (HAD superfamily)
MPLTLEQYANYLDSQGAAWPAAGPLKRPKATPYLEPLPDIRVVTWSIYGTLVNIAEGELLFEHPQKLMMDLALDKTVQEFKMWGSMSRKPGQPAEYLGQLYNNALTDLRMVPSPGEKHPEIRAERIWENILKKLLQKDYKFDAGFYGSLNEYSRKIAFYFHASLQGTTCYEGAAATLRQLHERGLAQGLTSNAQCFSLVQLQRGLAAQEADVRLDDLIAGDLRALSFEVGARKPSERLYKHLLNVLADQGVAAEQVLHVGSRIDDDIVPARRLGLRTALFAGDKCSLQGKARQLKELVSRPDVLVTELSQIVDVIGGS